MLEIDEVGLLDVINAHDMGGQYILETLNQALATAETQYKVTNNYLIIRDIQYEWFNEKRGGEDSRKGKGRRGGRVCVST